MPQPDLADMITDWIMGLLFGVNQDEEEDNTDGKEDDPDAPQGD